MYSTVITNKEVARKLFFEHLESRAFDKVMVDFTGDYLTLTTAFDEEESIIFLENIYRDGQLLYIDTDEMILDESLPKEIYEFYKENSSYESLLSFNISNLEKDE